MMSTLIICPACETRYEIAAVLPPEGRKVRCSKCGHVWQATAAGPEPAAQDLWAPQPPPPPQAPPVPQSYEAPQAAEAQAGRPTHAAVNPGLRGFAGITRPPPEPHEPPAPPAPPPSFAERAPEPAAPGANFATDADFGGGDDFEPDIVDFDVDVPAQRPNGPEPQLPSLATERPGADFEAFSFGSMSEAATAAEPASISISGEKRKARPAVALGWGLLALLLVLLGGLFVLAPRAVVSMLPGATRLYAMVGMPVNLRGLAFEGLHYGWNAAGGQQVLKVEGDIVNVTTGSVEVPLVVISLRDAAGQELSQWTSKVQGEQLAAGERALFVAEIPSPPEAVRSVKVRFAKAE